MVSENVNNMIFKNEDTFQSFLDRSQENRFHSRYEKAINLVSSEFGRTYPVIIDGKKIYTSESMIRTSPTDRRITLGYISKGNTTHAKKAIHAARMHLKNGV